MSDKVNFKFYTDQPVELKCHLDIEGVSINETFIRLCLEGENSENYYFKGQILNNGDCIFKIPKLKNISSNSGKAIIEVVADSTYFKLYECQFEIDTKVKVNLNEQIIIETIENNEDKKDKPKIQISFDNQESHKKSTPQKIIQSSKKSNIKNTADTKNAIKDKDVILFNDFLKAKS